MKISVETAMYVADSSYNKLSKLMQRLNPEVRRDAAVEWRTNYRKWVGNTNKQAAKSAEEEYFKKWQ